LHNGNNYASLPIGHSVHLKKRLWESWTGPHKDRIHSSWLDDLWRSEGVVHASRSAGWLYQVPMFHVWMGQQSKKSTLGAKTLKTKDISWTWQQEHFAKVIETISSFWQSFNKLFHYA
jgi:hypothetical protein